MSSKEEKESCAKIEELLKSMLSLNHGDTFKNSSSFSSPPPFGTNMHPRKISISTESNIVQCSDMPSNNESQLIDSKALMRFVSQHIQDSPEAPNFQGMGNSLLSIASTKNTQFTHSTNGKNNPFLDSSIIRMSVANTSADDSSNKLWSKKKKKRKKTRSPKEKDLTLAHKNLDEDKTLKKAGNSESAFIGDAVLDVNDGYAYSISRIDGTEASWILDCSICNNFTETSTRGNYFLHFQHSNHEKSLKQYIREFTLRTIPRPLPAQSEAVSDLICKLHEEIGFTELHLLERKSVWNAINTLISENLPDCHVELIGSSVSGCGLRDSEVDMVLIVNRQVAAERLEQCYELLSKGTFTDVTCVFQDKIPKVTFTHKMLKCNLTLLDLKSCPPIHLLLALYHQLDFRVAPLLTAFRYFAQICNLDKPDMGTLPPIAFPLLLIYFLQKLDPPVLPVLQETHEFDATLDCKEFLSTYKWCSKNSDSVGLLWMKLLKFYCFEYKPGEEVVSIRTAKFVHCKDKNWGTKFLAIEHPIELGRNLSHTIPNKAVFTYIMNVFMNSYQYFAYPQLNSNNIKVDIINENIGPQNTSFDHNELDELLDGHDEDLPIDDVMTTISNLTIDDINIDEGHDVSNNAVEDSAYNNRFCSDSVSSLFDEQNKENFSVGSDLKTSYKYMWNINGNTITKDMLNYEFKKEMFTKKEILPVICKGCGKQGHLKIDCPEEKLPPIIDLPQLPLKYLRALSELCFEVRNRLIPHDRTIDENEEERRLLENIVQETYKDAELTLFGSFCNGFGFENSDLDFCLTFKKVRIQKNRQQSNFSTSTVSKIKRIFT